MSIWRAPSPLVLASASKTRAGLLEAAGITPEILPASIDERAVEACLPLNANGSSDIAAALAVAKARDVSKRLPGRWVLGADQTLDCEGVMFHKPAGRMAAHQQIASLAGRQHRLTSAAALIRDGKIAGVVQSEALLDMRPLDDDKIAAYLDHAGAAILGSVGAYQLEGMGVHLFEAIAGDHFTILGLPMLPLLARMRDLGLVGP
ncbi:MAG: Maf family protein [Bosea sp. (in: a-proteobacteria)]